MAEFTFKPRKNLVSVKIEGKEYSFDISPTNGEFVKKIASMARDVESASVAIGAMSTPNWGAIDEAFDLIKAKQMAVVDLVAPGAWDELYAASGKDVMGMTELVAFIAGEIQEGFTKAQRKAVEPVAPGGQEV